MIISIIHAADEENSLLDEFLNLRNFHVCSLIHSPHLHTLFNCHDGSAVGSAFAQGCRCEDGLCLGCIATLLITALYLPEL